MFSLTPNLQGRIVSSKYPRIPIKSLSDIEAVEQECKLQDRYDVRSTYDVIRQSAHHFSDAAAIIFIPGSTGPLHVREISYLQLSQAVTGTANFLHKLGVGCSDVVSFILPNLVETHFINLGAQAAGISNPINPLLNVEHTAEILRAANTRVLFAFSADEDLWTKAVRLKSMVPSIDHLIGVGGPTGDFLNFDELLSESAVDELTSGRIINENEIAAYYHTGGSTGAPKLARHTHKMEVYEAWAFSYLTALSPQDRFAVGLPLFHVHAAIPNSLAVFFAGATQILLGAGGYRDAAIVDGFWGIVKKYHVTAFSSVPTVFGTLMSKDIDRAATKLIRFAMCGSAPLAIELAKKILKLTGISILEAYGLTEGTCVSTLSPLDGERRFGSIGLRYPYQDMKVVHFNEGEAVECSNGVAGHVVIRGPNVFPGYLQDKMNHGVLLHDGWLDTGDLGRRDSEGYFWLTGRAKDVIKRSGHTIDPSIIEECLFGHPAVLLAAAVGRPDPKVGEMPICFVTLHPGKHVAPDELRQFARETIGDRAAVPAEVIVIEEMPVTTVGKIFKPGLRDRSLRSAICSELSDLQIDNPLIEIVDQANLGLRVVVILKSETELASVRERLSMFTFPIDVRVSPANV